MNHSCCVVKFALLNLYSYCRCVLDTRGQGHFFLTPQRKHLGKAVARRSKKAIAAECMKDQAVQKHIVKLVGKMVHSEIKKFCSDSANSISNAIIPSVLRASLGRVSVLRSPSLHQCLRVFSKLLLRRE